MRTLLKTLSPFIFLTIFNCSSPYVTINSYPDCSSTDIEKMDTCLIGQTIKTAIEKLKIDTSQFSAFDEPPRILRGIYIQLHDTCIIRLYVDRTSIIDKPDTSNYRQEYLFIATKKIIGVAWRKDKFQRRKSIGSVIGYWGD